MVRIANIGPRKPVGGDLRPPGSRLRTTFWLVLACTVPTFLTAAVLYDRATAALTAVITFGIDAGLDARLAALQRAAVIVPAFGALAAVVVVLWLHRRSARCSELERHIVHGLLDQLRLVSLQASSLRMSVGLLRDLRGDLRDLEQNVVWIREIVADTCPDELDEAATRLHDLSAHCRNRLDRLVATVELANYRHVVADQDINHLLSELVELLGWEFYLAGIELELDLQEELPPVRGNHQRLCQAFQALLLNALAAVGNRGTVRIVSRRCLDQVEVVVVDSGPGIPGRDLGHIFDPLFTTRDDGIGLGLTVCRETIESMGGALVAGNEPGLGARFAVRLPVAVVPTPS